MPVRPRLPRRPGRPTPSPPSGPLPTPKALKSRGPASSPRASRRREQPPRAPQGVARGTAWMGTSTRRTASSASPPVSVPSRCLRRSPRELPSRALPVSPRCATPAPFRCPGPRSPFVRQSTLPRGCTVARCLRRSMRPPHRGKRAPCLCLESRRGSLRASRRLGVRQPAPRLRLLGPEAPRREAWTPSLTSSPRPLGRRVGRIRSARCPRPWALARGLPRLRPMRIRSRPSTSMTRCQRLGPPRKMTRSRPSTSTTRRWRRRLRSLRRLPRVLRWRGRPLLLVA
ncbi:hypothetical protein SAMN05443572_102497 [Myxococcus fulvus]|uniref:Uncharacterized protein n=1 Tax=Myxococcus fulvus TaxID=33 RepID=A0ABY1C0W3_MYXFU|nr:hypothetical protein SAMN05443572_102497 [Myxococcus fulvus]